MGKGKGDRRGPREAFVTLRDMPGTQVLFWVVEGCPYCGERHLHVAGHLRMDDPGEALGEVPAPCRPERTYTLTLPPRPRRKEGKEARRRERREARRLLDEE